MASVPGPTPLLRRNRPVPSPMHAKTRP